MTLSDAEFREIEKLARIDLEPEERERLRIQLDRILGFVRRLQELETGDRAAAQGSYAQPVAPDEPGECLDREEILGQAPDREDGFFRVPQVIERESGEEQ